MPNHRDLLLCRLVWSKRPGHSRPIRAANPKGTPMNKQYTKRPPARKPRNGHALSSFSMPVEHQGGRVRAWFAKNTGLLCIAVGWIFAFALIAIPKTHENAVSIIELYCFGSAFFSFGLGWIVRDETGKRDGR